jgi:hypothetical protein
MGFWRWASSHTATPEVAVDAAVEQGEPGDRLERVLPEVGRPVRVLRALREPVGALDRGRLVALGLQVANRRRADERRYDDQPERQQQDPAEPTVAPGRAQLVPDDLPDHAASSPAARRTWLR